MAHRITDANKNVIKVAGNAGTPDINTVIANFQKQIDNLETKLSKRYLVNSYNDGTTWYNIYSDGWKECGGIATDVGGSNGGSKIVLPINFTNVNYNISTTIYTLENTKDTSANSVVILNITNNSFNAVLNWTSSNGAGYFAGKFRYYCCGY